MSGVIRKLGLVLSGGGAKGAYQVGVVKALAHFGIEPQVIAGTSIGALNGAVLAASDSMDEASQKLTTLWLGLDNDKVIKIDRSAFSYVALAALHLVLAAAASSDQPSPLTLEIEKMLKGENLKYFRLLDSGPLENILSGALNYEKLVSKIAKDLYIGLFPATEATGITHFDDLIKDIWRYLRGKEESVFIRLQDYPRDQAIRILMASAAIPLAFKPIQIGDKLYRDGGIGRRHQSQGNTPLEPLIQAGCTHAIVSIISDGVLWNRNDWKEITPIEIRPSVPLETDGMVKSILNFNRERIGALIEQGEQDTLRTLNSVASILKVVKDSEAAQEHLKASNGRLELESDSFDQRVKRLKDASQRFRRS